MRGPFEGNCAVQMPATIRALHALPAFPRTGVNYLDAMDGSSEVASLRRLCPRARRPMLFELYERRSAVIRKTNRTCIEPQRFEPENVLFDGKRVWLVDWEAGFLNDRYLDLAVVEIS